MALSDYAFVLKKAKNNTEKYCEKFALITESGNKLELSMDTTSFLLTLKLIAKDGTILDTKSVDLPLEEMIVDGHYDKEKKSIILTLKTGTVIEIPVGDLVSGLVSTDTFEAKVLELSTGIETEKSRAMQAEEEIKEDIDGKASTEYVDNQIETVTKNIESIQTTLSKFPAFPEEDGDYVLHIQDGAITWVKLSAD